MGVGHEQHSLWCEWVAGVGCGWGSWVWVVGGVWVVRGDQGSGQGECFLGKECAPTPPHTRTNMTPTHTDTHTYTCTNTAHTYTHTRTEHTDLAVGQAQQHVGVRDLAGHNGDGSGWGPKHELLHRHVLQAGVSVQGMHVARKQRGRGCSPSPPPHSTSCAGSGAAKKAALPRGSKCASINLVCVGEQQGRHALLPRRLRMLAWSMPQ